MMVDTTPTTLRDMIALPQATMAIIQSAINSPAGGGLLLHGPAGTGKSVFSRVIAMEGMRTNGLVVPDYTAARGYPNLIVLDHVTGYDLNALNAVREQSRMQTLTATDRRWLIIEEFDSINPRHANFVKTWFEELEDNDVQVLASTNHLSKIDGAVRSRFAEIYVGLHPDPAMREWAETELVRLGRSQVGAADLTQLVNGAAGSVRALKRACFHYAEHGKVI